MLFLFIIEKNFQCITALESNPDIPGELNVVLQTLLKKYKDALEKHKQAKEKAEAEYISTTEKLMKDLQTSYDIKRELKELKKKFEISETVITYIYCYLSLDFNMIMKLFYYCYV